MAVGTRWPSSGGAESRLRSAGRGQAAITLTATEVGGDVLLTGSGTANLAGLTLLNTTFDSSAIFPSLPYATTGSAVSVPSVFYAALSGPANFGPGGFRVATSGTGDVFGVNLNVLVAPVGYTSGTPLSGSSTFASATFASLGMTPGTYVWTWGAGANADSLTLQIGPAAPTAAIPEPGTLALLLVGTLTTGAGFMRRRRS